MEFGFFVNYSDFSVLKSAFLESALFPLSLQMNSRTQIVLYTNTEYQLETTRVLFFPLTEAKLGNKCESYLYLMFYFSTFLSSCLVLKFILPAFTMKTNPFLWELFLLALLSFLARKLLPSPFLLFFSLRKMAAAGRRWLIVFLKFSLVWVSRAGLIPELIVYSFKMEKKKKKLFWSMLQSFCILHISKSGH